MNVVAIGDGTSGHEVRDFGTFTEDIESIVDWLKKEKINTVAMESTGVYWLNLYLKLEEAGIEPYLVNAKHVKNVTGRKRDDSDAVWIQKLHCCGLLQKSFQPEESIRVLRAFVRQRKMLILQGSDWVRRMQKSLELMNIKLHTVISDLLGKTGMSMVRAILEGERDPKDLIRFKDPRIKAPDEVILKSLRGIYKDEYIFMLQQAYDGYRFFQGQLRQCEEKIEQQLLRQAARVLEGDITDFGTDEKKKVEKTSSASMPGIFLIRFCRWISVRWKGSMKSLPLN